MVHALATPIRIRVPNDVPPEPAVVAMIGAPGSGKSYFATQRYPWHQILSSDKFRQHLTDDPGAQDVNALVFDAVHSFLRVRCARGLTTVVDAINGEPEHRAAVIRIARRYGLPTVAVFVDKPLNVCQWQNDARDRKVPGDVIERTVDALHGADLAAEFDVVRHLGLDDAHTPFDRILGEIPPGQETGAWTR